jgi:hypothetical protein
MGLRPHNGSFDFKSSNITKRYEVRFEKKVVFKRNTYQILNPQLVYLVSILNTEVCFKKPSIPMRIAE